MELADLFSRFPELNSPPDEGISVPVDRRVLITPRVRALLDTYAVQRLRAVRQLALAHLVYPGATHSRFEHTLGVFAKTCRYVSVLAQQRRFTRFLSTITEKDVSALLVGSLLHDIGHYPMAHAFEELIPRGVDREKLKHDKIAVRILTGEYGRLLTENQYRHLTGIIRNHWRVEPQEVAGVLSGIPNMYPRERRDILPLLHDILDGPLDSDKLDYLQRDSLHTGNPRGQGVDQERLVDSLVAEPFHARIGIKERGLGSVQSLVDARYNMFLTIYWHRHNRAANRMFIEALRILQSTDSPAFQKLFDEGIFRLSDEQLLSHVARRIGRIEARDLVHPLVAARGMRQKLYRRVLTISADFHSNAQPGFVGPDPHSRLCAIYDSFLSRTDLQWKWPYLEAAVRTYVASEIGQDVLPHHVLLDVPDARFHGPTRDDPHASIIKNSFSVYGHTDEKPTDIRYRAPDLALSLESWRKNARKVRLFVRPSIIRRCQAAKPALREGIISLVNKVWDASTIEELRPNREDEGVE